MVEELNQVGPHLARDGATCVSCLLQSALPQSQAFQAVSCHLLSAKSTLHTSCQGATWRYQQQACAFFGPNCCFDWRLIDSGQLQCLQAAAGLPRAVTFNKAFLSGQEMIGAALSGSSAELEDGEQADADTPGTSGNKSRSVTDLTEVVCNCIPFSAEAELCSAAYLGCLKLIRCLVVTGNA